MKKRLQSQRTNKHDNFHTPPQIALKMIDMCELQSGDITLDCCRGESKVFYSNLPNYVTKEWCEILENVDFFDFNKNVDVIVGNPPYSIWNAWIDHTIKLQPKKICYIFSAFNFTPTRLHNIVTQGYGITKIEILKVDYWMSLSIIALFEKNKDSIITVEPNTIQCDVCNTRCGRGRGGRDHNKCQKK